MIYNLGGSLAVVGGLVCLAYWLRQCDIGQKLFKSRPSFKERVQLPPEHEDILRMTLGQISYEIERLERVHQSKETPAEEAQAAYLRVFWLRRARSMALHY